MVVIHMDLTAHKKMKHNTPAEMRDYMAWIYLPLDGKNWCRKKEMDICKLGWSAGRSKSVSKRTTSKRDIKVG